MPIRTARTAWNGGFTSGSGQVELSSSKAGKFDVSFPKRTSDDGGGATNPDELIAAAHSSCFAMALTHELEEAGATPQSLDVTADVTLGPDPDGGLKITGIALKVTAEADGIDADGFNTAAEAAKSGCPVSKALTGTEITLDARLDSAG